MSGHWSEKEVVSIVDAYFEMLTLELSYIKFNKSEHRRALLPKLDSRSERSIESKHQNISAALIELGLPYIKGYKPLSNYQALLEDVIQRYLKNNPEFFIILKKNIDQPPNIPDVNDFLSLLVDPPEKEKPSEERSVREDKKLQYIPKVNYLEREEKNILVGDAGEQFVLNFEKARLILAGKENLADRIEHVSETIGPSAGYDIHSYETDGSDRYIEAKATKYGKYTPFYFSRNELLFSEEQRDKYFLYRVFELSKNPKLFHIKGSIQNNFEIEPFTYIGRIQ